MDFEDEQRPPRTYVGGPAQVRVVENGPVRVALEVTRDAENSHFVQTIRLAAGEASDRRAAQTDWQAYRLNVPLMAFTTTPHAGALGKSFSLASVSSNRVRILGLKKAELSDEIVVRLVELDGKAQPNVSVKFAAPVTAVPEGDGQEQPLPPTHAKGANGALPASFTGYQPRTFALQLCASPTQTAPPPSPPV